MREILFRGKRIDNGEWVEGAYCKHDAVKICFAEDDPETKHLIIQDGFCDWGLEPPLNVYAVDPETVGQYTGMKDKNEKQIFEGDILGWTGVDGETGKVIVIFAGGAFLLKCVEVPDAPSDPFDEFERGGQTLEIIGSVHDNPEFLKRGDEKC